MAKPPSLTAKDIDRAEPGEKPYRIADTEVSGLSIRVQPSGLKLYELRYGPRKSRTFVIGRWPNKTLAMARAEALRALVEIGEKGAPAKILQKQQTAERADGRLVVTLAELIEHRLEDHYKSHQKSSTSTLDRLRKAWSKLLDKPLTEITAWEVEKLRAERLKAGIAPGTANRDLAALRGALTLAVGWDLLPAHPLLKVKDKKDAHSGVIRFLGSIESDPDEEKRLRDGLAERDRAGIEARARTIAAGRAQHANVKPLPEDGYFDHITPLVLVAMNTGLRRGELTSLTWLDVDLARRLLTVRAGYAKSDKARHIPLNSEAHAVLTKWKKQHPKGKLFDIFSIKKAWKTLCDDVKIIGFRFHDLRHHFASRLVQAGVDLNTVRELLGHADMKMTLRYAHLAPSNTAAAVEKLVTPFSPASA